jgi:NAD(P)-dependent dehydrogenase (short-subunit alcohol dehydrogenase family)
MKPLEGKVALVAGATRGAGRGIATARGGRGIALQVDHTRPEEVARLFDEIGELDILVNDIWGGDELVEWGKKLWETKLEDGLTLLDRAIKTHIITSHQGIPRIRRGGLVAEITDGDMPTARGRTSTGGWRRTSPPSRRA